MKAIIVGSGPSAKGFVPPDGVRVIAVNGAIEWIKRADYWFTLDPSLANMRRWRQANQRPGVKYYAALPEGRGADKGVTVLRRVAHQGQVEPMPRSTPQWYLWRLSAVLGLSENPNEIHTGNSAYGAVGLAYHLGFCDVLLVGVDATTDDRVEGGTPGALTHLPLLFQSVTDRVMSRPIRLRTISRMDGIESTTLQDFLRD